MSTRVKIITQRFKFGLDENTFFDLEETVNEWLNYNDRSITVRSSDLTLHPHIAVMTIWYEGREIER